MEDWFEKHGTWAICFFALVGAVHGAWYGVTHPRGEYSTFLLIFGQAYLAAFFGVILTGLIEGFVDMFR